MDPRKSSYCLSCPYAERDYVPPNLTETALHAPIVLVGESPGREELEQGRYFVGPSGQVLDIVLDEAKIDHDDVAVLNVVRCDPGSYSNVTYDPLAVEMCSKLLWHDIERINPLVVVPMGNLALKAILNKTGITKNRGRVTELESGMKAVPTFHPAYVLRQPAYAELVASDLAIAQKVSMNELIGSAKKTDYKFFGSQSEVWEFFQEAHRKGYYALDIETTSLDYRTADVLCIQVSHTPYTARVLPLRYLPGGEQKTAQFWDKTVLSGLFSHLMDNKETTVYGQNLKFDLRMLHRFFKETIGLKLNPWRINWVDTQNMGALLNENIPHRLKEMARLYTDIEYDQDELSLVSKGQMVKMTMAQVLKYGGQDADATLRLGLLFESQLKELGLWHLMVGKSYSDMSVLKTLFDMELFGAPLSQKHMDEMRITIEEKIANLYGQMLSHVGHEFNANSHPQIRDILFSQLRLPSVSIRTPKGEMSTDKHAIDELTTLTEHPFPRSLKLHRQYSTILNTFVTGAEKRSSKARLHPDFLCARTVSGRIVCVNPNLANIPKDKEFEEGILLSVRGIYVARKGWVILYADWSQIEFKWAALLSGDTKLITALFDDHEDFHTLTAEALFPKFLRAKRQAKEIGEELPRTFGRDRLRLERRLSSMDIMIKDMRNNAKVYNFGQLYGGTDEGLAVLMGLSVDDVQELTRRRAEAYPQLARFIEYTPVLALEQGFIETAYGRLRRFPYSPSKQVRNSQGRQGINVGPQSAAAYVGRSALVKTARRMKKARMRGFPFNIVYDSILCEVPREEVYEASMILTEEMTRPVKQAEGRSFSIDFGVGKNWKQAEKAAVKVHRALKSHAEIDQALPGLTQLVREEHE
jgi:DNA polymerase-1